MRFTERRALLLAAPLGLLIPSAFAVFILNDGLARPEPPSLIVRSQLTVIRAPSSLIAFARHHEIASHEELERLVVEAGLERAWFALSMRHLDTGGSFTQMTYVVYPGQRADQFGLSDAALKSMAGKEVRGPLMDNSRVTIEEIPEGTRPEELLQGPPT